MTQEQQDAITAAGAKYLAAQAANTAAVKAMNLAQAAMNAAYQDLTVNIPARNTKALADGRTALANTTAAQQAQFQRTSEAYGAMIAAEQAYQAAIQDSLQTGSDPAAVI